MEKGFALVGTTNFILICYPWINEKYEKSERTEANETGSRREAKGKVRMGDIWSFSPFVKTWKYIDFSHHQALISSEKHSTMERLHHAEDTPVFSYGSACLL